MSGKEIAALELAKLIYGLEVKTLQEQAEDPRKYFFKLYAQCLQVAGGGDAELVLA